MDDLLKEINETIKRGDRVLVTALTKKLAEEISDFFASKGIKARYLHSEVKTLERSEIIRQLRLGKFDVSPSPKSQVNELPPSERLYK